MEHPAHSAGTRVAGRSSALLPHDRSEWPDAARTIFVDLLRQLDRWCRQHDWPTTTNAWIAEEAVRQSWCPR